MMTILPNDDVKIWGTNLKVSIKIKILVRWASFHQYSRISNFWTGYTSIAHGKLVQFYASPPAAAKTQMPGEKNNKYTSITQQFLLSFRLDLILSYKSKYMLQQLDGIPAENLQSKAGKGLKEKEWLQSMV